MGVVVRRTQRTVQLLAGTVETATEVVCELRVASSDFTNRAVSTDVSMLVVDNATEDMIIGVGLMQTLGLVPMLSSVTEDSVVHDDGGMDEDDGQEEEDGPDDGDMPTLTIEGPDAERLRGALADFADVFGPLPPEGAAVPEMVIQLHPGEVPAALPPRRLSPALQQTLNEAVDEWIDLGIVQPSTSPFSSPVVMVRKKDHTYRPCVDYRQLNKATVDMKFPLQNTRSILERMSGHQVFGTLDLRAGFHQMPLAPESQAYTAFATPRGLFEFRRVQFGLKNGPAHFQFIMSRVLNGLLGRICEVYIDDLIVYAHDMTEFESRLREVLQRLREHRLRVKGSKCRLGQPAVEFLGHVVDGLGVSLSEARKQGLRDLRTPSSAVQLKSFLGLASYFRTFVKNFATIAKPLHQLCSDKVKFAWTPGAQTAFEELKAAIVEAPVLLHVDYALPLILRTDASNSGVGGMLLQRINGKEMPVSFVSKAFTPVESRWSTIEQECFGVVFSIESLQHHLRGHQFVVETDHRNLLYLQKASAPKIIRWRLRLQEYSFEVKHIPGRTNVVADGLSRCCVGEDVSSEADTSGDDVGRVDSQSSDASTVAPGPSEAIQRVHNSVMGHRGVELTIALLREGGESWPSMKHDVEEFIRTCAVCQKVRLGQGSMAAALATTTVKEPFEVVAIDTIGPLPADAYGNEYIVAVIDCFTRYVELRATRTVTAMDAAMVLLDVFARYGAPKTLRSDQGPQFTAAVISNFLHLVGVGRHLTIPYRPESNGIVERANKEVGRHLRSLVMDQRVAETWSMSLPLIQRIINATPHRTTGTSPVRMLFGGTVSLNRGLVSESRSDDAPVSTVEDYVQQLAEAQRVLLDAARQHQEKVIAEYLKDSPGNPTEFPDGSYVLVSYPDKPPSKLHPRWRGPMVVVDHSTSTYRCQDLNTMKIYTFHVSRLKAFRNDRTDDLVAVASVDSSEYIVDQIVDHRPAAQRDSWQFRVHWRGYDDSDDSWLTYPELRDVSALRAYLLEHPELDI